eukprot:745999-Hanusia_phi.AAC.5
MSSELDRLTLKVLTAPGMQQRKAQPHLEYIVPSAHRQVVWEEGHSMLYRVLSPFTQSDREEGRCQERMRQHQPSLSVISRRMA